MNQLNRYISFSIFAVINSVFLYKYLVRVTEYSLILSILYSIILVVVFYFTDELSVKMINKKYIYLILFIIIGIQGVLLFKIPVENLHTDRWSVITSFLDELLKGNFPYLAKSHLNNPPGPFPGYYLFAFPFYFIGEIGLFSLSGILLFLFFLKNENLTDTSIFIILIILISSSVVWYELIVRSTIFVNMAIALIYFSFLLKSKDHCNKSLIFWGLFGGLVLSTRGIMLYIFIVFFTYIFIAQNKWKNLIIVSIFTSIGFILSLLPFIIWDWQLFMIYNPITLQASFIPKIYLILFAIIAFGIGYMSKSFSVLIGNIGVLLFSIVCIPFFIKVFDSSMHIAITENGFDISYFFFSIPFLIYAFQNAKHKLLSKTK